MLNRRRRQAGRAGLIQRKKQLEGEINLLRSELRRRRARGDDVGAVTRRLERAQQQHYQSRLDIDRAE